MIDGGYLSNGLHSTYLADSLPLDHWFHAFQVTFGEMITRGDPAVSAALGRSSANGICYTYPNALALYAACQVRPLTPADLGDSGAPG